MHAKRGPSALTAQEARAVLGVAPEATPGEIEAAFRREIRVAHPDQGGDPDRAELLLDARRCLRDPASVPSGERRQVVVVPASRWRDVATSVFTRVRVFGRRASRVR
jgi:hypothetical protein